MPIRPAPLRASLPLLVCALGPLPLFAQGQGVDHGIDLRGDARLDARLTLNRKNATVEELLAEIHQATGVTLTLDPEHVETKDPAFAHVRLHNMSARVLMERLPRCKVVKGYWVREGDGYKLIGTVQPRPAEPLASPWRGLVVPITVLVHLVLVGWLVLYLWRKRHSTRPSPPAPKAKLLATPAAPKKVSKVPRRQAGGRA